MSATRPIRSRLWDIPEAAAISRLRDDLGLDVAAGPHAT